MSKDVIELAKQLKQLAIDVKNERFDFIWLQNRIKEDWGQDTIPAKYFVALSNYHQIITLCEEVERLSTYENSESNNYREITVLRMDTEMLSRAAKQRGLTTAQYIESLIDYQKHGAGNITFYKGTELETIK
ncbi:hypothetical protein XBP1_2090003 [Xenorhabdus bovienii str. puntauvense]|uniref:Uncharacterized protein n=1 Tax=Xenorhabdus bovienii str. puntauvense TaxID=1398201 RepID=A0A077NDN6_XENBV|nr:hypothetical protein [Xenorhabdus bovienii]CDG96468.1 hypothetical protein XBP1_2090003 [Xenorhabdus bovienii str. puntauvense]